MSGAAVAPLTPDVPVETTDMTMRQFFERVWPREGLYVVARMVEGKWRHTVCASIPEAEAYARQFDSQGVPTYFAVASFRERSVESKNKDGETYQVTRVQENVRSLKVFFMDLDVDVSDSKKFASQEAAIDALLEFCQKTGIPVPNLWINSGFGVHVYWVLRDETAPEQWKPVAESLKRLCAHHQFKADPACTGDSARVLRPVGTGNRKEPGTPRPVELVYVADSVAFEQFRNAVLQALRSAGVKPPEITPKQVDAEHLNDAFKIKREYPPISAHVIADRCQQFRKFRDTRGCIPEPYWFAALQLAAHTIEGDSLAHAWSAGYSGYSYDETQQKLDRVRGMGPSLCKTFESRNPGGCAGCPFLDKISSPAQIGGTNTQLPAVAMVETMSEVEAVQPNDTLMTTAACHGVASTAAPTAADDLSSLDEAAALALVMHAPTEDNVARLFERQGRGHFRYCKSWGSWLVWDGARWRPERTDLAFDFARDLARAANPSGKGNIAKAAFARGVESFARASRIFASESDEWDRDEFLLNAPGGVVELRNGHLRQHNQADGITKITRVTPRAGPKPVFDRFMQDITCGDDELIAYHQRSLGAILSGATADHWLLFWIGAGRNGKNTLGDLIAYILGDYSKVIPTETLMSVKTQSHPTEIANLRGIRLAISSEVAEGSYWNESRIKSLTGDTTIAARFMRGDFFEFPRTHKHLIFGNHRPMLRVVDDAIRARMHVVPFRATFSDELGNRDPLLHEKLRAEAPQILAWLIEGHIQWVGAGYSLEPCAAVAQETQEYLDTQSTPALWVTERCEVIENDDRPTKELPKASVLYKDYATFKQARGENVPSMTRWGEWMNTRFQAVKSNGVRYRGIRLKPLEADTMEWVLATRPNRPAHSESEG